MPCLRLNNYANKVKIEWKISYLRHDNYSSEVKAKRLWIMTQYLHK
jgi:hypothetical protein